jgi:hypothetical protein
MGKGIREQGLQDLMALSWRGFFHAGSIIIGTTKRHINLCEEGPV